MLDNDITRYIKFLRRKYSNRGLEFFIIFFVWTLLFCMFFLSIPSGVGAYPLLVPTITATFIPPSATPTPFNNQCPVGTPAGWGTYTPSPLWQIECGSCASVMSPTPSVTPSPFPTYSGTGTPPVTPTLFVTPTSTPSFSALISCPSGGNIMIGSTCSQVDDHTILFAGSNTGENILSWNFGLSAGSSVYVKLSAYDNDVVYWHFAEGATSKTILSGYQSSGENYPLSSVPSSHGMYSENVGYEIVSPSDYYYDFTVPYSPDLHRFFLYVAPDSEQDRKFYFNSSLITASGLPITGLSTVTISTNPLHDITTPTPEPFDTGYCSSVTPVSDDFGFDLFIPDGELNCSIGWDGFDVGTYHMPDVQICFQPSQFGVITMFGYTAEIGTVALAVAGAFIWRFMRTV